jgi:hypothetical protein
MKNSITNNNTIIYHSVKTIDSNQISQALQIFIGVIYYHVYTLCSIWLYEQFVLIIIDILNFDMIQNEYNQAFQTSSFEFKIKLNAMLLT